MESFKLTDDAIFDIDAIWLYLLNKEGVETADRIVTALFKGFDKLAGIPTSGHRRADLTNRQVLFYKIFSYAKAEYFNPGGSVKDRPALNTILKGEQSGRLTPDKIIIRATSGNTGIAYAMIAAAM